MIKPILIASVTCLIIAGVTHHLVSVEKKYSQQVIDRPVQLNYEHIFKGFSLANTGINGSVHSVIRSPSTRVLVEQHKTYMDKPEITLSQDKQTPIVITANSAQMHHNDNITTLTGNVQVTLPNDQDQSVIMVTEKLELDNITLTAKTDLMATIIHERGHMQGTGIEFNPHIRQFQFLNNVRGIYE